MFLKEANSTDADMRRVTSGKSCLTDLQSSIASQNPRRSFDFYIPSHSLSRNDRDQIRVRNNLEAGSRSVDGDRSCSGETLAENSDGASHLSERSLQTDKRRQAEVQTEDRAVAIGTTGIRHTVESSIGMLHEPRIRIFTI